MSYIQNPFRFADIPLGNIVAYYRLDNNGNDETGTHNGTASAGVTYGTGKAGNSAIFNAAADKITVSDSNELSFLDGSGDLPFSLTGYFKKSSTKGTDLHFIIYKGESTTNSIEYQFYWSSTQFSFILRSATPTDFIRCNHVTSVTNGTWYHFAATYDGSESHTGLKIYIDGVESSSTSMGGTYTGMTNKTSLLRMGEYLVNTSFNLVGELDGMAVWNIELTSEQVTSVYDKQNAGQDIL